MRSHIKYKFFGGILSDGSFSFFSLPGYISQQSLKVKGVDILNHSVWTGRRPKEQTEISAFIGRFNKKK